jgi:uncharacterized protein
MTLLERIDADLKEAMKSKNEQELSTLRLLRSALKNKEIDLGKAPTDDEVMAVAKTLQKQYQDALGDFERAGRADLAEKQKAELVVIKRYLPEMLPADQVEAIVKEAIAEIGASSAADVGKVMGAAMKKAAGRADGGQVREIAQKLLTT